MSRGTGIGGNVCHVGDNLRIWAERLAGIAAGASRQVTGYDENDLGRARGYTTIPLQAAQWSLTRSMAGWQHAIGRTSRTGVVLIHPDRGELTFADVILANAHDAFHHRWDIERSLPFAGD